MSFGSAVFKTMLRSKFSEGIMLAANGSCTVELPDDDSLAMIAMCRIIHHQAPQIDFSITADFMKSFAVTVEKYDCVVATSGWGLKAFSKLFRPVSEAEKNLEYGEPPDLTKSKVLAKFLYPAYLFDAKKAFKLIIYYIVLAIDEQAFVSPFQEVTFGLDQDILDALPEGLLSTMIHLEDELKSSILDGIEERMHAEAISKTDYHMRDWDTCSYHAQVPREKFLCDAGNVIDGIQDLKKFGLLPTVKAYRTCTLGDVIMRLNRWQQRSAHGSTCDLCLVDECKFVTALEESYKGKWFAGLCLKCVKAGHKKHGFFTCKCSRK
ncbi:hypothetical protein MMC25_006355 [Agyrium rufum]|nr:hypothetical protein [Agyrium rufum]